MYCRQEAFKLLNLLSKKLHTSNEYLETVRTHFDAISTGLCQSLSLQEASKKVKLPIAGLALTLVRLGQAQGWTDKVQQLGTKLSPLVQQHTCAGPKAILNQSIALIQGKK